MFPFILPWDDAAASFANLSDRLHKPAGLYSFVTEKNGHLFAGDSRIRFVGMNFSFSAAMPASNRDAEVIAARLAKFGVNCVRLTLLDNKPAPEGILRADMRTFDAEAVDRLDYFVHQLKQNGIYVLLQLHVARTYPGLSNDAGTPLHHAGIDNYFGAAIDLQKEYARKLLGHLNPYTGKRYADDPVVAFVEINNENALSHSWWNGSLDKAPNVFRDDLQAKWNEWLTSRYANQTALKKAWPNDLVGTDVLSNGKNWNDFSQWSLLQSRGAVARVERAISGENAQPFAKISVLKLAEKAHDIQFCREPLPVDRNISYTLEFDARTDASRQIAAGLIQPSPFKMLYLGKVNLSSEWQKHRLVFTPTESSSSARFCFSNLASMLGDVWVRNVSLKQGGSVGLLPEERLGRVPLVKHSEFTQRNTKTQTDWLEFLADVEDRYWSGMYRYLRDEIKLKSLIIGTQQNYSPYFVQRKMDVIDMHGYWDTQSAVGGKWFQMRNTPQVGDPHGGVVGMAASRRLAGKPFIVSEYNYRGANTYASEADLLMFAYASLQDWDGVFIFNYANNKYFNVDRMIGDEGFNGHSNRFAALLPAALMFHRGDVRPSVKPVTAKVTRAELLNKMRVAGSAPGTYDFGMDIKQPLKTGVAIEMTDSMSSKAVTSAISDKSPIVSDTGELVWDPAGGKGLFTINTPRTKALIGFVKDHPYDLGGVLVQPGKTVQGWLALTLSTMEGGDIGQPGSFLLTATGNSENRGMMFNADRTRYTWGEKPVLVEGINATIIFPVSPERVNVWALDERGNPKTKVEVLDAGGKARIEIGESYRTLWYKIQVR